MTCHICAKPSCVDDCMPRIDPLKLDTSPAPVAASETRYREAIGALVYAIEHPESNQQFAVEAGRQALATPFGKASPDPVQTALLVAQRTLVQLRCSFARNSVGYQDAAYAIDQCERALALSATPEPVEARSPCPIPRSTMDWMSEVHE